MAIGNVVQEGIWITIYDEQGKRTAKFNVSGGLQGYTSSTVTVKDATATVTYDEHGRQKSKRIGS